MKPDRTVARFKNRFVWVAVVAMASVLMTLPAAAQSMEDKLREELRATVTQLRQLQDDQAALQAQKVATEQERDALKAQLAAATAQLAHMPRSSGISPALGAELAKYKDAYTQAVGNAQQAQNSRDKLQADLASAQYSLSVCETRNTQLVDVGNEILASYESFDLGDALGANEPFIAIKRVELENLAQDFGDRLYDGRFDPRAVHPPAAKPPIAQSNH